MIPWLWLLACPVAPDTAASGTDVGPGAPVLPGEGELEDTTLDCTTAWEPPEAFTGTDGLGAHGWELDDLTFRGSWGIPTRFETAYLSKDSDAVASSRVRPWLAPALTACVVDRVEGTVGSATPLTDAVRGANPFVEQNKGLDELRDWTWTPPTYTFGSAPLYEALAGLAESDNPFGGPSTDTPDADLLEATLAWPESAQRPLAELVLALGEATSLKQEALAGVDLTVAESVHDTLLTDRWWTDDNAFVMPSKGSINDDIVDIAPDIKHLRWQAAAQAVALRADAVLAALASVEPFDGGDIRFSTRFGEVWLRSADSDDAWDKSDLNKVTLLVDLGGDDAYQGSYAATHKWWMGASVLLDVRGDDTYGADTPDITEFDTEPRDAFGNDYSFTQGAGLFGVGLVADASGDDTWWAGALAQGAGVFGVGVLYDADGSEHYQLGTHGQGMGFFGTGLLVDAAGSDHYGIFTMGQGAGKAQGVGALIDGEGDDTYIAFYNAMDEWLPAPGYPDHYGYPSSWPYSESDGTPHYMSCAQGVGWGYRGDWFDDTTNWAGGLGALVDLGDGEDVHYADDMSMGQGFIYGHGMLYDGGGDDLYRMFWWGMGASAHMGVGVLYEEGGNDDYGSAWASAGFGYDWSIGWNLDYGGDDVYSGKFYYGRAYTYGMSFMINEGGDDVYNADEAYANPYFGVVNGGNTSYKLLGAFLDLGGGDDTYNTSVEGPGNDATWYHEPVGSNVDADKHKGIGIDR